MQNQCESYSKLHTKYSIRNFITIYTSLRINHNKAKATQALYIIDSQNYLYL